jgi:hypothetical protein
MTDIENLIEDADAIPEAVPFPQTSNGGIGSKKVSPNADRKLSIVSKKYDIDGDGRLDAAEQASKSSTCTMYYN